MTDETVSSGVITQFPLTRERMTPDYGGGPPPGDGTDMQNVSERLARLEGQITTQQWAVALISAALIGATAIVVGMQFSLTSKVDALPSEINGNLQTLVTTLSAAITATDRQAKPTVVIVPQQGEAERQPSTPQTPDSLQQRDTQ